MSDLTQLATGILPASGYKAGVVYGIGLDNYTYLTLAELKEHVFYDGIKHALTGYAVDRMYYFDSNKGSYVIRFRDGVYQLAIQSDAFDFTSARNGVANRTNSEGLLEEMGNDVCRVEYPTCPSLLLEPASTNLITESDRLDSWLGGNGRVVNSNAGISPDGTQNADEFLEDSSLGQHRTYINKSVTTGLSYTFSAFIKPSSGSRNIRLDFGGGFTTSYVIFNGDGDLVFSSATTATGKVIYPDGWVRVWATATSTSTVATTSLIYLLDDQTTSYQGDGTSGFFIWSVQLELGEMSSRIATTGTTVTRPQDTLVQTVANSDMYNDAEGVLMIDGLFSQDGYITLVAGTDITNSIIIASVGGFLSGLIQAITEQTNLTTTIDATVRHKVALRYQANNFSLWIDGVKEVEDLAGLTPTGLDNTKFNNGAGASVAFGLFAPVYTSPTYMSDEDLIQLTT